MDRRYFRILTALMVMMVLLTAFNVAISFLNKEHPDILKNAIRKEIESIKIPQPPLPTSPIKGVDYFDGKDGKVGLKGEKGDPGKDSISTHTIEKQTTVIKEPIVEQRLTFVRCNDIKNRLEIKYEKDTVWTAIKNISDNSNVKCVHNAPGN